MNRILLTLLLFLTLSAKSDPFSSPVSPLASGWTDDNEWQGHINVRQVGGRRRHLPFLQSQISQGIYSDIGTLGSGLMWSDCWVGNVPTNIPVSSPPVLSFTFTGTTLSLSLISGYGLASPCYAPFDVLIDGEVFPCQEYQRGADGSQFSNQQVVMVPVADNLSPGSHFCQIYNPPTRDITGTLQRNDKLFVDYVVDEADAPPQPDHVGRWSTKAVDVTTVSTFINAGEATSHAGIAYDFVRFRNSDTIPHLLTLTIYGVTNSVFWLGTNSFQDINLVSMPAAYGNDSQPAAFMDVTNATATGRVSMQAHFH